MCNFKTILRNTHGTGITQGLVLIGCQLKIFKL